MGRRARVWLTIALALSMGAGQLPSFLLRAPTSASANQLAASQIVRGAQLAQAGYGGMRNTGTGTIVLAGVSGTVRAAYLYWQGPTNSTDPAANAAVTFGEVAVTGTSIGSTSDNCWGYTNSRAYRADVTSTVRAAVSAGGASFSLAGFRKTATSGAFIAAANGVSLIVFFDDPAKAGRDFVVWDGNDSNVPSTYDADGWDVTFAGLVYTGGAAKLHLHVADGQTFTDGALTLNGSVIAAAGALFDGNTTPAGTAGATNGSLWDIRSFDPGPALAPGATSARLTAPKFVGGTAANDCLSLVVGIIDLPNRNGGITLTPAASTADVGQSVELTALATAGPDPVAAGTPVSFRVTSGPNASGVSTTVNTDPAGAAKASFRSAAIGTDTVLTSFSDPYGTTRTAQATITWIGLSGIAQCGAGPLANATVELLSGKTVVAKTTADASGAFAFPPVAPNAAFTLRYTSADGMIVCVASVAAGADGAGTVAAPSIPSLGNSTWPTAFRLNTEGAPQQDYLAVPRDAWFKVSIGPSQQVVVSLRNCAFDCSLVLYTDIDQAARELAAQSIASGQRQIAPAELSPAELSPAELSPAELSPAELSPAELSPAELSPAELSPAELSPAELSPAELSPAELSPAELSAVAYSSAQTRSILAVSAHAGLSPELIVRNTWEHTGDFYMRVLSHDGTTSTQPFTISSRVLPGACVGVNLTKVPSTLTASAATSIILTNTSRLTNSAANATAAAMTVAQFTTRLNQFATKNGATVIDLAQDGGIQANYANWDAHPACALAANTVADSIYDLIGRYRALGGLKYITLAGSDGVIPFRRVPDLAGLGNESTYHVPVLDSSQSAAALHSGYFLSQDYYASPSPILRGNLRIDLPQEGIGRIVESLGDMTAMLDAYDAVGGVAAPKTAVSTGYDFLADLANELKTTFQAEGVTVDTLIEAAGLKATDPTAWTADQLRTFLFGAKAYGIYAINGHFSGNRLLAADYATLIGSEELTALPANDTRYRNALILSMGCHAGYNIVDADAIPNATQSVGWVEGFNARGATVVGSTGYGYADTDFVQYSELVLSKTATALGIGPVPVAIGDALRDAKSSYLSSLAAPEGIDAKAAAEATVYGLPMMRFDVARPSSATGETPLSLTASATSTGLQYGTPVLSYILNGHTELGVPVAGSTATVPLTYYDASGDIQVSPLQAVLPRNVTKLGLPANAVLRGGALLNAQYTEVSPIFPRTDAATTETRGQLPTAFASVFTPLRLFALNQVSDRSLVVLPLQYLTDGVTGTARLYDSSNLHLRLYTSTRTDASALAAAPAISNVVLTPVPGGVHVDAVIGGLAAAGLEDVLFTYTNGANPVSHVGTWQSRSLRDGALIADRRADSGDGFSEHVSGDILTSTPFELRLFVQAVSGNAQVSVSSNIGAYFRLDPPTTATGLAPKHATTLTFTAAPAASTTYGGTISATVLLTDGATAIVGKPIAFEFGGHRVRVITTGGGLATAHFEASFVPTGSPYKLTAAFAEDQDLLGSELAADVTIVRATSALTTTPATTPYSDGTFVTATLRAGGAPLHEELVTMTLRQAGTVIGTKAIHTDGAGRARLDARAFGLLAPGSYVATADYAGSAFYTAATGDVPLTVTTEIARVDLVAPGPQPASGVTVTGTVTQDADGSLGDLGRAIVTFTFQPEFGSAILRTVPVAASGSVSVTTPLPAGVYTVSATVGGWFASGPATTTALMPVYDPSTFATGGGYTVTTATTTPAGKTALPSGKKANFGFNVKYKDGTTTPTGSLLFQLKEASIDFKAVNIDWLVIADGRAEFQGSATINGSGGYTFRVTAVQGATSAADRFEIRIWSGTGSFDAPTYVVSNALGGGSIKVH